jgi:integrase
MAWDHRNAAASLRRVDQSDNSKVAECKRVVSTTTPCCRFDRRDGIFKPKTMQVQIDFHSVLKRAPLDRSLKDELAELFKKHLASPHSRTRVTSNNLSVVTQERRLVSLTAAFVELRRGGYAIQTPWNLADKHIRYLVQLWVTEKHQSPGTVENKLTYLRTLASWVNKHQLVRDMDAYIERPKGYRRHYVALKDKSWQAANVDFEDIVTRLSRRDRWVAIQIELQAAFGLRAQESMMLRPVECVRLSGHLHVVDGTKGGRPRVVPITEDWQNDVLKRAAHLANPRTLSMIPEPWTLKKWRRHFYSVLETEGISAKGKGVTPHGLRHEYLQRLYESIAGVPAPIKCSDRRPDPTIHNLAMKQVVEAAGHSLAEKATAYISTFATMERASKPVISSEQALAALEQAEGVKTDAAKALGVSRQALYRLLSKVSK